MVELVEEELGVRVVPDRDEDGSDVEVRGLAVRGRTQSQPGHRGIAEDLLDDRIGHELDLVVRAGAVEHDRRCAELVAPVDDRDLARELGEEDRLLHRGVAAADDSHRDVAPEGGVAHGAVGHAFPLKALLGGSPSCLAVAPVETITDSARYSSSPTKTENGRSEKSTRVRRR